jgi:hypothetical protein
VTIIDNRLPKEEDIFDDCTSTDNEMKEIIKILEEINVHLDLMQIIKEEKLEKKRSSKKS